LAAGIYALRDGGAGKDRLEKKRVEVTGDRIVDEPDRIVVGLGVCKPGDQPGLC
jgi:hypothetical protein